MEVKTLGHPYASSKEKMGNWGGESYEAGGYLGLREKIAGGGQSAVTEGKKGEKVLAYHHEKVATFSSACHSPGFT